MNRSPITYTLMNNGRECFLEFLKIGAEPWEIQTQEEFFNYYIKKMKKVNISLKYFRFI